MSKHEISRKRMEVRHRKLVVATKHYLTPGMLRIGFTSDELQGFESPSADDHIKIFVRQASGAEGTIMRDFTPRAFDSEAGTLTLDFALHQHGPAIDWARQSKLGDVLQIGGPRGSAIIPDDFDWYLLVGDETALPAIGRRVEGLPERVHVSTFVVVASAEEQQEFTTRAHCESRWISRNERLGNDSTALQTILNEYVFPQGDGHIWIAAETSVARDLYKYLSEGRGHPKKWIKAAGYWTRGKADAGEKIA